MNGFLEKILLASDGLENTTLQAMVVPDPAKGGDRSTFRDLRRYP
jgi:hypothetical protein